MSDQAPLSFSTLDPPERSLPAPYYKDSAVTLYHGDCREILPLLETVDHVITDPPYEAECHTEGRRVWGPGGKPIGQVIPFAQMDEDTRAAVAVQCRRLTRRWSLVFCQVEGAMLWRAVGEDAGLGYRRTCVWVKPDGKPQFTGDRPGMGYECIVCFHQAGRSTWNGGGRHGVFTFNKNEGGGFAAPHPTTKPDRLMRELVGLFTDPGETVLDPFAGSGSTLRACKDLGRKAIGIEMDRKYCDVIVKRMAQEVLL